MTFGTLPAVGQFVGFVLASYGVLRECFADLAEHRPYGEGRYGEGTYGGDPSRPVWLLVSLGIKVGLLPADRRLTLTDRKRNAGLAVAGVLLIGLSMLLDLWLWFTRG